MLEKTFLVAWHANTGQECDARVGAAPAIPLQQGQHAGNLSLQLRISRLLLQLHQADGASGWWGAWLQLQLCRKGSWADHSLGGCQRSSGGCGHGYQHKLLRRGHSTTSELGPAEDCCWSWCGAVLGS